MQRSALLNMDIASSDDMIDLRGKVSAKRARAILSEPPGTSRAPTPPRVSSKGSSTVMGVACSSIVEEAFVEARLRYVAEYKASKAFKRVLLNASVADFIQGFENCKVCIKYLMP